MTSIFRVALPFRWTLPYLDMFPNIDRIRNIHSPVLLIHGTRDEIVPFTHAEELFEDIEVKWRACPFWIEGGGHNNLEIFHK